MPNNNLNWDAVDEATLRDLYLKQHMSDQTIAERYGVTKYQVTKRRKEYGISVHSDAMEKLFKIMNNYDKYREKVQIDQDAIMGILTCNPRVNLDANSQRMLTTAFDFINRSNPKNGLLLVRSLLLSIDGFTEDDFTGLVRGEHITSIPADIEGIKQAFFED